MDKIRTTPKDFFLWAGVVVSLYWSITAFLLLMFDYLNYALPIGLDYVPDPYQSGMPYEMASLLVLFPLFLVLMILVRRDILRDPSRSEVWVRRWALVLTLFIAGLAIAADLIALLSTFFSGEELTSRFLLKVALILLVAAAVFMHFIADLRGYWAQFPQLARRVGWGAGTLAVLTILAGFAIVGTPWQARQYRLDEQRVSDLQQIQSQILNYWQSNQRLPKSLSDLSGFSGFSVTVDPQTKESYGYSVTGTNTFKLCADFIDLTSADYSQAMYDQPITSAIVGGATTQNDWQHGAGQFCFARTINPAPYLPKLN